MEDDLQWKTTFGGRQPSMEDNLQWKTTFGGSKLLASRVVVHYNWESETLLRISETVRINFFF